jgi:putative endonuclease
MPIKTGYVYIVASATRTIYVGVTSDLPGRIWQHNTHAKDGFTKRYNVTKLVYVEELSGMSDAIAWEKSLKVKTRAKKISLIEERNPRWNDLAWNWFDDIGSPTASPGDSSLRSE